MFIEIIPVREKQALSYLKHKDGLLGCEKIIIAVTRCHLPLFTQGRQGLSLAKLFPLIHWSVTKLKLLILLVFANSVCLQRQYQNTHKCSAVVNSGTKDNIVYIIEFAYFIHFCFHAKKQHCWESVIIAVHQFVLSHPFT